MKSSRRHTKVFRGGEYDELTTAETADRTHGPTNAQGRGDAGPKLLRRERSRSVTESSARAPHTCLWLALVEFDEFCKFVAASAAAKRADARLNTLTHTDGRRV